MPLTPLQRAIIEDHRERALRRRLQIIRDRISVDRFKNNTFRKFMQSRNETIRNLAHDEWFYKTNNPRPITSTYSIGAFKELGKAKKNMYDDYRWAKSLEDQAQQYQYKKSVPNKLRYRVLKAQAEWFRRRAQAQKNAILDDYNNNKKYYNYKPPVY